jgi:beta-glucosidase
MNMLNISFFKKTILLSFFVILVKFVSAQSSVPIYLDQSKPIEVRVENALSLMTLEEKVAMCHAQSKFSSAGVPRLGIPEVWMSDGPHGVREEIEWDSWSPAKWTNDSCTAFPALTCLAATFNPEMASIYGKAIGEEARYRKKDILLGPGVNIYRTPLNGRNFEYMGEDPYLASKMVVPYIQGVQQIGVAACVKHFALNNQEMWRGHINVELSDRALYEIYLPAFKAAVIEGKSWSIMGAYNKLRGQHCCHNDLLLNKILKNDWNFDGVVISDWAGAHNTKEAIANGLDIEMGTWTDGMKTSKKSAYNEYYLADAYLSAIKNGEATTKELDDKVSRILRLVFRTSMDTNRPWGSFASPEHAAVCRQIAEEGIVLLKNSNSILPLKQGSYKKILVVGENATRSMTLGGGSSALKVKKEISPLQGIEHVFGNSAKIEFTQGYSSGSWREPAPASVVDSLKKVAVEKAKTADLIIFFGGLNKNWGQDSEGGDRKNMDLPYEQDKLISDLVMVNKNIVVNLITGNAVSMPWINNVSAVVQTWYLGSEAGNAIASVLSGNTNPSGKLPFTFPVKLTDFGAHSFDSLSYPGNNVDEFYKEDILVGYRWFDTKKIEPLFPFGYGLSYTTFKLGKANIDKKKYAKTDVISLKVPVTNAGLVAGSEVVQVYITDNEASVVRPEKELKGFAKVQLNAGETKEVEIEIPVADWAFYSETVKNWVLEPGKFTIQIGNSSRAITQKIEVTVE